jgi:hypothetical protein
MKARLAHLLAHKLPQWRVLLGAVMSAFPGKFPRWILRSVERYACIGLSPEIGGGQTGGLCRGQTVLHVPIRVVGIKMDF